MASRIPVQRRTKPKMKRRLARSLPAALATAGIMAAGELPVRQVILYKHGVAFFERSGDLASGESAKLDFKATDMDDVLKSLTVEEAGGGKITGVRYDSSQPLANRLADFPFKLGDRQSLAQFLDQLKGARIEVEYGNQPIKAAIVSGRVTADKDNKELSRELLVVLTDAGDLRTIDLGAVQSLRLTDPSLQLQLREYLTAVGNSRNKDQRSVYIDSADKKGRKISANYMIPMPVWKSSYRLQLPITGEPMLEGWAIIDNTTADDWTNIKLSVVSGRPISFITKLYDPKFMVRPKAELAEDRMIAPEVYAGGIAAGMGGTALGAAAQPEAKGKMNQFERLQQFANVQSAAQVQFSRADVSQSTITVSAEGREMGELFEYSFATPVTVKRNESAMIPFLQQKLGARKLLIYSDHNAPNPRNAAEISNSTGKTLDGGPITVYDSGAYGGEALMETLKAADKRLISYGIDLGTRITTAIGSVVSPIREVHLRKGTLTTKSSIRETVVYTIKNVDSKAKTLIIERPIRLGYTFVDTKPSESTDKSNRFEVKLAPNQSTRFPVIEESQTEESLYVSDISSDVIAVWVQNKALTAAARQGLERIKAKQDEVASANTELESTTQQSAEIIKDQERLRQNLGSLNRVAGQEALVQKYVKDLADQENTIAQLRDKTAQLRKRKIALESELGSLIDKLEF